MRRSILTIAMAIAGITVFGTATAQAGYKMEIDENSWVSIGMGMRAHVGARDSGGDWDKDIEFDDARLYINGGIVEGLTFELNTYTNGSGSVQILDSVAKIAVSDAFNIWAGRFLPPSDRANLSGPYYLNTWHGPWETAAGPQRGYSTLGAGRDDGAAVWGQFQGGKFKYQVGVFKGNANSGSPNFAARVVLNLLDPEPGYYNSSTYYGGKDVLAIGAVYQVQGDGASAGSGGDSFNAWNIDILYEKNLGDDTGTVTLDAAIYGYSDGDEDGTGVGAVFDGVGFYALGGFLLPGKVSMGPLSGSLQPTIRYEQYQDDNMAGAKVKRIDAGVNWILKGHSARMTFNYGKELDGGDQEIILGMQYQY